MTKCRDCFSVNLQKFDRGVEKKVCYYPKWNTIGHYKADLKSLSNN